VEEQAGREEEPARTEEPARSSRLRQRRLEFVTLTRTTTMTTGDGGSGSCGGSDDDDGSHDAGCHDAVGSSSGLRKPYERGPSTLPTQKLPYWHYDSPHGSGWTQPQPQSQPQLGWCAWEQGGGAGTLGDGFTS
jgi:hypothetical protein